jgi:hypothetical protein
MERFSLIVAAIALGLAGSALAAPVSYGFTGNVTHDDADRGYASFAGSFSFDSAATNQNHDPSASMASYTGSGPMWSLSLSLDGGALLEFSSQGLHVNVMNDNGGYDWLGLLGQGSDGTISAGFYDFTTLLFDDASLPLRDGGYQLPTSGGRISTGSRAQARFKACSRRSPALLAAAPSLRAVAIQGQEALAAARTLCPNPAAWRRPPWPLRSCCAVAATERRQPCPLHPNRIATSMCSG